MIGMVDNLNLKFCSFFTLGENKQATVTLAERLIVTDIDVMRNGT